MKKIRKLRTKSRKKIILGPKREATKEEKRNMFGKVIEILIVVTTENHVYKFGNEFRVQAKGGPIGLRCTGEMADCCMIDWDKILIEKLKNVGIEPKIYKRFKDDINVCTESLEKGSKLVDGEIIIDEEKRTIDEGKSDDIITMEIIREIAETIDPNIKLTIDSPSSHEDKLMPILDLKVGLNPEENYRIDYQFFEKPTKNEKVLMANAAMRAKSIRTILTQECLRIFRNTSLELGEDIRNKHLNKFMLKLKNSGHSVHFRKQILNSAFQAFQKMIEEDINGTKPMFRARNWNYEERCKNKIQKKRNWFKNNKGSTEIEYAIFLFVPPHARW